MSKKYEKMEIITKLKPHQVEFLEFAYNLEKDKPGGILLDEMGLGKTLQLVSLFVKIKNERKMADDKMLVVCPNNAISEWINEVNKHTKGIKIERFVSEIHKKKNKNSKCEEEEELNYDILIINYDKLVREHRYRFETSEIYNKRWYRVILDESHYIRNSETYKWKSVRELKNNSTKRWLSTGTPVQNCVKDMFTGFDFISADEIGTYEDWSSNTEEELFVKAKKILNKLALRRKHTELLEVKKYIYATPFMNKEEQEYYELTSTGMLKDINSYEMSKGDKETRKCIKEHVLATLIKLRQLCVVPKLAYPEKLSNKEWAGINCTKMKMLKNYMQTKVKEDEKVILFSNFLGVLDQIEILFNSMNIKFVRLDGTMREKDRNIAKHKFINDKTVKVFIICLLAGNNSMNLQVANRVIFTDIGYNPQLHNQGINRLQRIGQKKQVIVTFLFISNTIEKRIMERCKNKTIIADCVLDPTKKINDALQSFRDVKQSLLKNKKDGTGTSMKGIKTMINSLSSSASIERLILDEELISRENKVKIMKNRETVKRQRCIYEDDSENSNIRKIRKLNDYPVKSVNNNGKIIPLIDLSSKKVKKCKYVDLKERILDTNYIVEGTFMYSSDWLSNYTVNESLYKVFINPYEAIYDLIENVKIAKINFDTKIFNKIKELNIKLKLTKNKLHTKNNSYEYKNTETKFSYESLLEIYKNITYEINSLKERIPKFYQDLECVLYIYQVKKDLILDNDMKYIPLDGNKIEFEGYTLDESIFDCDKTREIVIEKSEQFEIWCENDYIKRFQTSFKENDIIDFRIKDSYQILSMIGKRKYTMDNKGNLCTFEKLTYNDILIHVWDYYQLNYIEIYIFTYSAYVSDPEYDKLLKRLTFYVNKYDNYKMYFTHNDFKLQNNINNVNNNNNSLPLPITLRAEIH